ncbi:MAG: hypothetical protein K2K89_01040, partial [Ruminococcus sp.]|nr:hypothetical protein [Ruminococcus sp.]
MNDFICSNFIMDIENSAFDSESYLALLCGSSLIESNPRDTDIFIYTTEDEQFFCKKLVDYLSHIDKTVKYCYLNSLEFHSVKYVSAGISYSLHVVSKNRLYNIIQKASLVETYTDINVFDVKLYSQTAYRKWIIETKYLIGNVSIKEELIAELLKKEIPVDSAQNELIVRLKNNINYFNEKVTDDIVLCNLIVGQIINNLINYLYLVNGVYYGTLKYIKSDMRNFMYKKELSELTI